MRLQKIRRNEAKLASIGLLGGMTSSASPSSVRPNRKNHAAPQGDFVRMVQPKCYVFKPTSYKDLDDPVISKRTRSIDFSDTGEEDTGSKRMDKVEYSPSSGDDEEEDDEDKLESYNGDDNDDDDELDRLFPQAKAEAAVEALTDIYGHSKTVSYCDTNDLDLQPDEDGDEVSKKSSFNKIANTEPDFLHLIADLEHHREVNCTIRFSNSDSNGPRVFEAAVNNDDLKPPARRTVLPPPPCLRLTMQRRKRRRRRRRSLRSIIRSIPSKR